MKAEDLVVIFLCIWAFIMFLNFHDSRNLSVESCHQFVDGCSP